MKNFIKIFGCLVLALTLTVPALAAGEKENAAETVVDAVATRGQLERNKLVVTRLFMEGYSGGNLSVIDELVSPDFEFVYPNLPPGIEGLKAIVKMNNRTFEGWHFTLQDVLAVDDKVVVRWIATGKHIRPFLGETPTGKTVQLKGISIYSVKGGIITKDWVETDNLGFLTQLGIISPRDFTKNTNSVRR